MSEYYKVNIFRRKLAVAYNDNLRNQSLKKLFGNYLRKFSSITSIHGVMYLGEPKRPLFERLFWIIIMSSVAFICGIQVYQIFFKWMQSQMTVKVRHDKYNLSEFPYPAITICRDAQLQNLEKRNDTNEISFNEFQETVQLLCNPYEAKKNRTIKWINSNVLKLILSDHGVSCNEFIEIVQLRRHKFVSPCPYFQPIITSYGLCYSLNMVPFHSLLSQGYRNMLSFENHPIHSDIMKHSDITWSPDKGFKKNSTSFDIPWKIVEGFSKNSISLALNFDKNNKKKCSLKGSGYVLILHSPVNVPNMILPTAYIFRDEALYVSTVVSAWPTSQGISNWKPRQRKCYFQHEKKLKYFKIYTENNCDVECRANISIKKCGCSAFYHPREKDTPFCGKENYGCMESSSGYSIFDKNFPESFKDECDCLPDCNEVRYEFKVVELYKNNTPTEKKSLIIRNKYRKNCIIVI
ncbi:pickpocket protein 28-like isoform X2 [Daktulosphaira vitifoliae]|uniref:pickpocket protein 28-like isoform X2 n=1 Tax=Daktulosphaira vitifoliae TaxID=58002 RepID=UPI0021AAC4DF|nr:pickpocket protein 28-like isoform X2 [Daktulosphaira vitifoliae]